MNIKIDQPDFYLVWREGTTPHYKHNTYQSAKAEAERLTREHGGTFHVLEHRASAKRIDVELTEVEKPF